jgi:hypothetical protein
MFTALAAAAALSFAPAQPDGLKLTNLRWTIGELGPTRKETKVLPGDLLWVAFDIEGIEAGADRIARYQLGVEVTDAAGKAIIKEAPADRSDDLPLRGNKIPCRTYIIVGLDQPAGTYTCKVTAVNPKTKATTSLTTKFEVLKPDFGIVAVSTSYDENGILSAPTLGVVGQTLFLHFAVASFTRDMKTKQPNVEFLFEILDEAGKPVDPGKKFVQDGGVDEKEGMFRMRFSIYLSRTGKFTAKVTAVDKVANKKTTYELPFTVLSAN